MPGITAHQLGGGLLGVDIFVEYLVKLFRNRHLQSELLGKVLGDQSGIYSLGYFGPNERTLRYRQKVKHFKGCAAGTRTLGIESNGNVKGCLSILPGCGAREGDYVEGNLRETSLVEIWNRPGAFPDLCGKSRH